jgi:hypothetical protein
MQGRGQHCSNSGYVHSSAEHVRVQIQGKENRKTRKDQVRDKDTCANKEGQKQCVPHTGQGPALQQPAQPDKRHSGVICAGTSHVPTMG